jgi:hypothetical protein
MVDPRFAARASGEVRSSHGFQLGFSILPNAVDWPELFDYRRARWSCITTAPDGQHREDACPGGKCEDGLLKFQPSSVVIIGGTAVN